MFIDIRIHMFTYIYHANMQKKTLNMTNANKNVVRREHEECPFWAKKNRPSSEMIPGFASRYVCLGD